MKNLRAAAEQDLSFTLESTADFGIAVELIAPNGDRQTQSANDATLPLSGQVLYDTMVQDPATGIDVRLDTVVHKPVVTLRVTSLDAIPERGWIIKFPLSPVEGEPLVSHHIDRVSEDGRSLGFIRIYPGKLVQAP